MQPEFQLYQISWSNLCIDLYVLYLEPMSILPDDDDQGEEEEGGGEGDGGEDGPP